MSTVYILYLYASDVCVRASARASRRNVSHENLYIDDIVLSIILCIFVNLLSIVVCFLSVFACAASFKSFQHITSFVCQFNIDEAIEVH